MIAVRLIGTRYERVRRRVVGFLHALNPVVHAKVVRACGQPRVKPRVGPLESVVATKPMRVPECPDGLSGSVPGDALVSRDEKLLTNLGFGEE